MGCDWGMYAGYKITFADKQSYDFVDFCGGVGIYLTHDEADENKEMEDWLKICPNITVIYENSVWTNVQDEIVYSTPCWCGVSIQHSMSHLMDLLKYEDMSKILKIEAFPYAERRP
jgi:hypothetical protein